MIKTIYADIDATMYERSSSMNTGIDSILELSKISSSAGIFTSRILIKFPLDEISSSVASGDISEPSFYLNLYQTDASELSQNYSLVAYPVSQSWQNGQGRALEPTSLNGFNKRGVSWTYRNKLHEATEYLASKDLQWTSQSLHSDSNMVYNSVTGGGTWYKDYYGYL